MWLSEPFTRSQAWIDLLLTANHAQGFIRKRGILIEIKRGQVGESEETLADRWKWSRGKLRRFLDELISVQQITREPVQQNKNLSCLITITNYHEYQKNDTTKSDVSDTTSSTTDEQQIEQQTNNRQYRNKNDKNNENDKKEELEPKTLVHKVNEYREDFDKFWKAYPRKEGKGSALKAWNKFNGKTETILPVILSAIEVQKKALGSALNPKSGPGYIPHPASWLNGRRWDDDSTFDATQLSNGSTDNKLSAGKCYTKSHGVCGATWAKYADNLAHQCHWCPKFKKTRENPK